MTHGERVVKSRPSTFYFIGFRVDRVDVIGLPGAAVHDVPDRWRRELGRAVVYVLDVSHVFEGSLLRTNVVSCELDGAAVVEEMLEATFPDVDLEGVTSKTKMRAYKRVINI